METKPSGVPSAKQDVETIRSCVFAAPSLRRARVSVSISTAESGLSYAHQAFKRELGAVNGDFSEGFYQ